VLPRPKCVRHDRLLCAKRYFALLATKVGGDCNSGGVSCRFAKSPVWRTLQKSVNGCRLSAVSSWLLAVCLLPTALSIPGWHASAAKRMALQFDVPPPGPSASASDPATHSQRAFHGASSSSSAGKRPRG